MAGFFLLLATLALSMAGFAMIALSQRRRRRLIRPSGPDAPVIAMRLVGSLLIAASIVPVVLRDGLAFGLLIWTTLLSVAAVLVVIWLAKQHKDAYEA